MRVYANVTAFTCAWRDMWDGKVGLLGIDHFPRKNKMNWLGGRMGFGVFEMGFPEKYR